MTSAPRARTKRAPFRRAACSLAACTAVVLATTAAAASPSSRLVYVRDPGAASCPDETHLREAVARRVGYDPFFPWAKLTVVVEVTGDGRAFTARVMAVDDLGLSRGVRELRSGADGCKGLIDDAALAISIALQVNDAAALATDPSHDTPAEIPSPSESAPGRSEPPTTPRPTAPGSSPRPSIPTSDPAATESVKRDAVPPTSGAALAGIVGLDAFGAIGAAPDVVPGLDLWIALRRRRGELGLELRADAPDNAAFRAAGHASIWLLGATLDPCVHAGVFMGCALATLDWLHASGSDVSIARSGSAVAFAAGARAGLEVPLGPALALRAHADASVHAIRPRVTLSDVSWRLPLFEGVLAGGLAYRFP